jgi:hypothetical protein
MGKALYSEPSYEGVRHCSEYFLRFQMVGPAQVYYCCE